MSDHETIETTAEVVRVRRSRPKPVPPSLPLDSLCTPAEAVALRRQSLSGFWRHVQLSFVPPPIYIGPKSPRWRVRDVLPLADAERGER